MSPDAFPDVHWGREKNSPLFTPMFAFASTSFGSRCVRALVPLDRRVLAATNGKYTLFGPTTKTEMLLTMIGRKSANGVEVPSVSCATETVSWCWAATSAKIATRHGPRICRPNPEAAASINGDDVPVAATLLSGDDRESGDAALLRVPHVPGLPDSHRPRIATFHADPALRYQNPADLFGRRGSASGITSGPARVRALRDRCRRPSPGSDAPG
ncbi:hypothetical protein BH09ACT8_BH09ACT8_53750 [soil metagenome]